MNDDIKHKQSIFFCALRWLIALIVSTASLSYQQLSCRSRRQFSQTVDVSSKEQNWALCWLKHTQGCTCVNAEMTGSCLLINSSQSNSCVHYWSWHTHTHTETAAITELRVLCCHQYKQRSLCLQLKPTKCQERLTETSKHNLELPLRLTWT